MGNQGNSAMPRVLKSPLPIIALLLSFTLASFWSVILWKSAQERTAALAKIGAETQGLTHSLAQHASKSFGAVSLALFGVRQYIEHSEGSVRTSAEINDLLAQYAKQISQVREIGVLSPEGDWLYSSFEKVPAVNNADREYFQYHLIHPDDHAVRISEPLISRVTGRPTLLMTQRLSNADRSFGGVAFAAIDLDYFRSFYRGFGMNHSRSITMMKTNGRVLIHRIDMEIGKDLANSDLFSKHLIKAPSGLYSVLSPFDGLRKQFSYEVLPDFPVVVSVAVAEDEILAGWQSDRLFDLMVASVLSAIMIGLGALLVLQFHKRSAMAQALRERERNYRLLAENVGDVVSRLDLDGKRLYSSPSIEKLLGYSPSEILHQEIYHKIHPVHRQIVSRTIKGLGPHQPTATCEYLIARKGGDYIWVEAQFNYVADDRRHGAEIVGVIRNIQRRKETEKQLVAANQRLKEQAETDALTGIANRRRFDGILEKEFRRCQRSKAELSLLFIDIDKFKGFNDTYGHSAGDHCIGRVAGALASSLKRPADLVARYGGEEFAVLLPETNPANAEVVAETLREAVAKMAIPHKASPHGRVTISLGVAGGKCEGRNGAASMLAAADGALYVAKEEGRNRVSVATENPSLSLIRPTG